MSNRFTDLPTGLASRGVTNAGLAAMTKTFEALFAEISHAASPPPIYPSFSADGLEDVACHTPVIAKALRQINAHWRRLIAIEMIVSVQAIELRGIAVTDALAHSLAITRKASATFSADRPVGGEIEALAALL